MHVLETNIFSKLGTRTEMHFKNSRVPKPFLRFARYPMRAEMLIAAILGERYLPQIREMCALIWRKNAQYKGDAFPLNDKLLQKHFGKFRLTLLKAFVEAGIITRGDSYQANIFSKMVQLTDEWKVAPVQTRKLPKAKFFPYAKQEMDADALDRAAMADSFEFDNERLQDLILNLDNRTDLTGAQKEYRKIIGYALLSGERSGYWVSEHGREGSALTCMPSEFLSCIRGDLSQIDIRSSNFTFLPEIVTGCDEAEIAKYRELMRTGDIYSICPSLSRDEQKEQAVMYLGGSRHIGLRDGRPTPRYLWINKFREMFPSIDAQISEIKKNIGFRGFARLFQRAESSFFYGRVYPILKKLGIAHFYKHDSVIVPRGYSRLAFSIVRSLLNVHGKSFAQIKLEDVEGYKISKEEREREREERRGGYYVVPSNRPPAWMDLPTLLPGDVERSSGPIRAGPCRGEGESKRI